MQLHYRVRNGEGGEQAAQAHVSVNEGPVVNVSSLNHRAGWQDVVPIQLELREGSGNTITFGVSGEAEEAVVLDGIEVVED